MLQALAEHGITADLAVGTSVGWIKGAVVAREPKGAANRLSYSSAHPQAGLPRRPSRPGPHAAPLQNTPVPQHRACRHDRRFLSPATSFADLMVPFAAVTTHVAQRVNIRMPFTDPHWRL
jgi:NTE family protein